MCGHGGQTIESGETHAAGLQNHLNFCLPLEDNLRVNRMSQSVMVCLKLAALLEDKNIDCICPFVTHTFAHTTNADAHVHIDLFKTLFGTRLRLLR